MSVTRKPRDVCEYGDHKLQDPRVCYCYTDTDNGVAENTVICKRCYAKHILKYYPDSRVAQHMRKYPEEYDIEQELTIEVHQLSLLEAK